MTVIDETKSKEKAKQFGCTLIQIRTKLCINQEELAYRIGSSQTYLSQLEAGHKTPSLLFLYKLSDALNIDIKEFFPDNITKTIS